MDIETVHRKIESSEKEIIELMSDIIRVPAIAPASGGDGESARADVLMKYFQSFDEVQRIDVSDLYDSNYTRSNILAKMKGQGDGTLWFVAHIDTVPIGNIEDWKTDPFNPTIIDGKIYGRGTEDNGQALVSSLIAANSIPREFIKGRSLGLAFVADEEMTSETGIIHLIKNGYFGKDDVFIVPDWGSEGGELIEIAEKNLIWLKFKITGKSAHGSTPEKGINAFKIGCEFLVELISKLNSEFGDINDGFVPPISTFEPTKAPKTVDNVNTIPGYYEFSVDMRLIPEHEVDNVKKFCEDLANNFSKFKGVCIDVEELQRHASAVTSSCETELYKALSESIQEVQGIVPKGLGIGGATCANFFRLEGFDALVWENGGGTLHGPNEYVEIDNIIKDAKVFATLIHKMCG